MRSLEGPFLTSENMAFSDVRTIIMEILNPHRGTPTTRSSLPAQTSINLKQGKQPRSGLYDHLKPQAAGRILTKHLAMADVLPECRMGRVERYTPATYACSLSALQIEDEMVHGRSVPAEENDPPSHKGMPGGSFRSNSRAASTAILLPFCRVRNQLAGSRPRHTRSWRKA